MDRESVLNLPDDEKREKLYDGAGAVEGSFLAELFDAKGERVYLYDIYGYEHSTIYVSRQKVSQAELNDLLAGFYLDQNIDEIYRLKEVEGVDAERDRIEGVDLPERLFAEFGMLRISCEQKIFEDDFRLRNYA